MHNLAFNDRMRAISALAAVVDRAAGTQEQADIVALVTACRVAGAIDLLADARERDEAVFILEGLAAATYESQKRSRADHALSRLAAWEKFA